MLAVDRPGSDDREVPAVPDTWRPEAAGSRPDRGAVLTDAGMRQEHALAYRAKVDALYGRAEPENVRGSADQLAARPNIAEKYCADYLPATHDPPKVGGPHELPEKWVSDINLDAGLPGRRNNCGECARAVYSTWHGEPKAAAALADARSSGEPTPRMDEWSGQPPVPASMTAIGQRLTELGPGSSAIVGCDWKDVNAGHWFNAVNDGGTLKTVEGQRNRVGSWPPVYREVGFDESMMRFSDAIFFNRNGKIVPNDNS
jgi:hypothetical protein